MGAPGAAAVQLASQTLLFCWADSGTETGRGALRLGEQQVEPLLTKIKWVRHEMRVPPT